MLTWPRMVRQMGLGSCATLVRRIMSQAPARWGLLFCPMAVVSQYGRVYGLEGLWVADASIMLDCIHANTNTTTIMIWGAGGRSIKEGKRKAAPARLELSR